MIGFWTRLSYADRCFFAILLHAEIPQDIARADQARARHCVPSPAELYGNRVTVQPNCMASRISTPWPRKLVGPEQALPNGSRIPGSLRASLSPEQFPVMQVTDDNYREPIFCSVITSEGNVFLLANQKPPDESQPVTPTGCTSYRNGVWLCL